MSRLVARGAWQMAALLMRFASVVKRFPEVRQEQNCRNTQKPIWISAVLYSVNNYQHLATVLSKLNHDQVRVSLEKKPAHDVKVLTFLHLRPTFNSKSSFLFVTPADLCLSTAARTNIHKRHSKAIFEGRLAKSHLPSHHTLRQTSNFEGRLATSHPSSVLSSSARLSKFQGLAGMRVHWKGSKPWMATWQGQSFKVHTKHPKRFKF